MGRARNPGERYPGGKPKKAVMDPNKPAKAPMSPAQWARMVRHWRRMDLDPRMVTEVGRLWAAGELTELQAMTAHKVAEVYGRYERFQGFSRSARSPSYNASFGSTAIAEHLLDPETLAARERAARRAAKRWHALQDNVFGWLRATLEQLCVEDKSVNPTFYGAIRLQLKVLAPILGVEDSAQAPSGGQRRGAPSARRHTPLHFNQHEDGGDRQAQQQQPRRRADIGLTSTLKVLAVLRPDLSEEQMTLAYEKIETFKSREFERRGRRRESRRAHAREQAVRRVAVVE